MEELKYKLTEETFQVFGGSTLYRIEALKDFGDVKKGDKGASSRMKTTYPRTVTVGYMTMLRSTARQEY